MQEDDLLHIYDVSLFNISDLDVLLHETLKHAREILSAEAGTIYIKEDEYLKFHVFQNDAMSYENIYRHYHSFRDLALPIDNSHTFLSVDALVSQKVIIIDDIYQSKDYIFKGTLEFDKKFEYKSVSVLSVPLIHPINNESVGVIQLINKIVDDKILPFDLKDKEIISMLSSFVALSIYKAKNDVKKLDEANKKLKESKKDIEKRVEKEVKTNQEQSVVMFHKSKMASMGEMLSNIAHQWRQPLSTISTIASGLSLELQLDKISKEEALSQLRKIVVTTQNLSQTIDEFKSFYNLESVKEKFSIDAVVTKCLGLAEVVLLHSKIEVITNVDKSIKIYGFRNEFTQAFLNILTALKDSLIKKISTVDKRLIFVHVFNDGNNNIVKIFDNSNHDINSSENHQRHINIFNMGLYMTKLIIQKHFDGDIEFKNTTYIYNDREYLGGVYTITLP